MFLGGCIHLLGLRTNHRTPRGLKQQEVIVLEVKLSITVQAGPRFLSRLEGGDCPYLFPASGGGWLDIPWLTAVANLFFPC